ncbi:Zn-dependent hydrolase [Sedimentitalea sp. XS_ASV28]|uniref:Zn-dependent hydrolase n=1 Tax=Sedimentitalea sp. XS_ASV28 TaxID=3241296 RepID=UPI003514ECFE
MQLHINADRLWQNLMDIAQIGGTTRGGCNRQALTDLDIKGRTLFASWCTPCGFDITYDAVGNMFARMKGRDDTLPPLVIGSHLDTQPTGGKFDGVLGVLAGLEVMRVLSENDLVPERPVEVACWMNEEGARFAPAMMGSGVYSGMVGLEEIRASKDHDKVSVGEELDRHGYAGMPHPTDKIIHSYLELHIEQGPVLEREDKTIGIVTGAQGIRWYDISISGQEVHAGPFPMAMRRDPVAALPALLQGVRDIGTIDTHARATIGQLNASPGSRNVVPGEVSLTVDLRHPNEDTLTEMHSSLEALLERLQRDLAELDIRSNLIWHSPVVAFDPTLIDAVRKGVAGHGYSHLDLVSGAGHDALMVARKVPTTMIFIPCRDGLSHNEAEHTEPYQVEAGANVLLSAACNILGLSPT